MENTMPKFALQSEDCTGTIATLEFEKEYLPDILQEFERFLRASAFGFNGTLEIVPADDYDIHLDEYNEEYGGVSEKDIS